MRYVHFLQITLLSFLPLLVLSQPTRHGPAIVVHPDGNLASIVVDRNIAEQCADDLAQINQFHENSFPESCSSITQMAVEAAHRRIQSGAPSPNGDEENGFMEVDLRRESRDLQLYVEEISVQCPRENRVTDLTSEESSNRRLLLLNSTMAAAVVFAFFCSMFACVIYLIVNLED
jgi:hypothetical protein